MSNVCNAWWCLTNLLTNIISVLWKCEDVEGWNNQSYCLCWQPWKSIVREIYQNIILIILPDPLTLLQRLSVRRSTMSKRKEKSATLYMWMSSGSEAMDFSSFSSAFFTPERQQRGEKLPTLTQAERYPCVEITQRSNFLGIHKVSTSFGVVNSPMAYNSMPCSRSFLEFTMMSSWDLPSVTSTPILRALARIPTFSLKLFWRM